MFFTFSKILLASIFILNLWSTETTSSIEDALDNSLKTTLEKKYNNKKHVDIDDLSVIPNDALFETFSFLSVEELRNMRLINKNCMGLIKSYLKIRLQNVTHVFIPKIFFTSDIGLYNEKNRDLISLILLQNVNASVGIKVKDYNNLLNIIDYPENFKQKKKNITEIFTSLTKKKINCEDNILVIDYSLNKNNDNNDYYLTMKLLKEFEKKSCFFRTLPLFLSPYTSHNLMGQQGSVEESVNKFIENLDKQIYLTSLCFSFAPNVNNPFLKQSDFIKIVTILLKKNPKILSFRYF
jgi:hypothetical protein